MPIQMCPLKKNADNPLLEVLHHWWPDKMEDMLGLVELTSENVCEMVVSGLDRIHSADKKIEAAETFPRDCLLELAKRFPKTDKVELHRCVAYISEILMVCLSLTEDWEALSVVGDMAYKAGKYASMVDILSDIEPTLQSVGIDRLQQCVKEMWCKKAETNDVEYLPPMLKLEKTKELYLCLRDNSIIEGSVTEEDFLQIFGNRKSSQTLSPIKWQATKSDMLILLRGIYDKWDKNESISWSKTVAIANQLIVDKNGEPYKSMKKKDNYKGNNSAIEDFLATI